jgi:hypothetical protein
MLGADLEGKLHMEAANNYISVRNDIRFFLLKEIKYMDEIEALARIGTITNRVKGVITRNTNG